MGPMRVEGGPASVTKRSYVGYAAAAAVAGTSSAVAYLTFGRDLPDVVTTYLLGIVIASLRFDLRVSLVTALLSVVAFDFFFIPPYFDFALSDLRHIATFSVMLLVAVIVAGLTQRVRDQAAVARRSERRTALLYALSRELSRTEGLREIVEVAAAHMEQVFDSRVAIWLPEPGGVRIEYVTRGAAAFAEKSDAIARQALARPRGPGVEGTPQPTDGEGFYVPLLASGLGAVGVVGLYPEQSDRFRDPEQQRLADAFATQMATAIERARISREAEQARLQVETEKLRSALLSSVSHDLRTPLAVMKGAASTLVEDDAQLSPVVRRDMHVALLEETERLERLVRNLLDMTRLESGAVHVKREWHSIQEIVGATWSHMEARLEDRPVDIRIDASVVARVDNVLFEQVLVNLLENAAKYTPPGSPIDVSAGVVDEELVVEVADRGPGVPAVERAAIFDKFHRGPSDSSKGGVGLGLTICRAIVAAHGGKIWVEGRDGGGAVFKLALPTEGAPPMNRLPEIAERASDFAFERGTTP
jgi:two-component system sensor histidine kinase KdpD